MFFSPNKHYLLQPLIFGNTRGPYIFYYKVTAVYLQNNFGPSLKTRVDFILELTKKNKTFTLFIILNFITTTNIIIKN